MPTPTRRGQVRSTIRSDDSFEMSASSALWCAVSDESFLEMEKLCESPVKKRSNRIDETLLCDVQEPSFLIHSSDSDDSLDNSVFERPSMSMLSPMKRVAMRRPSTIPEESTIRSINSSDERSGSSLSLKQSISVAEESNQSIKSRSYRPSLVNVFPTRSRIGFYDNFDSPSPTTDATIKQSTINKENSINLMRFENVDTPPRRSAERNCNKSLSLMNFDESIGEEASPTNLSVDRTTHNSSMSDSETPDQFNDTLEAVDYYMKQGKKLLDKTNASTTLSQPLVTLSPINRNNSLLKQTLARRHLMSMNGDSKLASKQLF